MGSRRAAAIALTFAASVLAFGAIFAIWLNRQVLNTDNWTATSSELLADPVIRDQVGVFLVDSLYDNVDVTGEIRAALPLQLKPLAQPAAGGLRTLAERAAKDILARPRAQLAWENANRRAHAAMLKVLDGGTQNVSTTGGTVVLDLGGLLTQLADRLGLGGRLAAALPPGAGQITVVESDQLATAQDVAKALRRLPLLLVGLSLALFCAALLVAPANRRTTVRGYGAGLIAAGAGALLAASLAGGALVDSLARTAAMEPVVAHTWTIITPLLKQAAGAALGYGLFMVIGAWLAGPTRPAVAFRRTLAPFLREPAIAYAGFAVFVVVILWWGPTPALRNPATAALLAALAALGFEALRRRTAHEFPDASRAEALQGYGERISHVRRRLTERNGPVEVQQSTAPEATGARLDGLERLARLHDGGAIDDGEYRDEKRRLLATTADPLENGGSPVSGDAATS